MTLTISATSLGQYTSSRFCPRCEWLRLHTKALPYQTFPGIFSSIDSYNKRIVQNYFDRENTSPTWMHQLGKTNTYINPPHWSSFSTLDKETDITLRGEADAIFKMNDESYTIIDYKTAKYTQNQGAMIPIYEAQLNAYAYIGMRQNISPVKQLALVYMEPQTDERNTQSPEMIDSTGFTLGFHATVVQVAVKPDDLIPPLLKKAQQIHQMKHPPSGISDCRNCKAVNDLIGAFQ